MNQTISYFIGETGEYFRLLTPGFYEVYVTADGYQSTFKQVNVTNDSQTSAKIVNFALMPEQPKVEELKFKLNKFLRSFELYQKQIQVKQIGNRIKL